MKFITIATDNYVLNALRLVRSLKRAHPESEVIVYSESGIHAQDFQLIGARLHVLEEITTLGVKRAKFTAYAHAAVSGGFVYLDADILVLRPLVELLDVTGFTACRDDLSECPFIPDADKPWASHPEWSGSRYFNSGVFSVPEGFFGFFEKIRQESLNDQDWNQLIIPEKLFDNHYLCAKVVQYAIPVRFIPEKEYNWQGFLKHGQLNCAVDSAGDLRNNSDGSLLRLVHFAGIRNIDDFLSRLPTDVLRILGESVRPAKEGVLELVNAALACNSELDERLKLLMIRATLNAGIEDVFHPGAEAALVSEPSSVASIALSTKESDFVWNGLKCGGSYLSASEYQFLRQFMEDNFIESVLEFGAGYTSVLFSSIAKTHIALEGWEGPWLEYARAKGCDASLAMFSHASGFDEKMLTEAANKVFGVCGKSLVFLDIPPETVNRGRVVEQLVHHASNADFYVIHDSVRDAQNVYRIASALDLRILAHVPSSRGLTFLGKTGAAQSHHTTEIALAEQLKRVRFSASLFRSETAGESDAQMVIEIKNCGDELIATGEDGGLCFSVHLYGTNEELLAWDTPRYHLPVSMRPGDVVAFPVVIPEVGASVSLIECDFVKEGEFWWSHLSGVSCPRICID